VTWQEKAACRDADPNLFFPDSEKATAEYRQTAERYCAGCPVKADCLADAMRRGDPHGLWGGMDPEQRAALARQQGKTMQILRKEDRVNRERVELVQNVKDWRQRGLSSADMAARCGVSKDVFEKRLERARRYVATGHAYLAGGGG
jgi:WhiB family redox-sensing transcriptional regulator